MMFVQLHNKINFVSGVLKIQVRFMRTMTHKMPNRIVIYSKDVQNITGRKARAAQKLLANIRIAFGKDKAAFVTVREFSLYTGIEEDLVKDFLLG